MKKLLICLLTSLCSSAFASNFYVGGQAGLIYDGLDASNNYSSAFQVLQEKSNPLAGRLFAGYEFNKYFSLEAGYLMTTNTKVSDIGFDNKEIAKFKIKEQIADITGKAKWYMGDKFFVYGKVGAAYINVRDDARTITYQVKDEKNKNINVLYGLGIGYDITDHVSTDISWTRYNGSHDAASDLIYGKFKPVLDFYSLSVTYKF
jgi:opacity protein-like surface antigen